MDIENQITLRLKILKFTNKIILSMESISTIVNVSGLNYTVLSCSETIHFVFQFIVRNALTMAGISTV